MLVSPGWREISHWRGRHRPHSRMIFRIRVRFSAIFVWADRDIRSLYERLVNGQHPLYTIIAWGDAHIAEVHMLRSSGGRPAGVSMPGQLSSGVIQYCQLSDAKRRFPESSPRLRSSPGSGRALVIAGITDNQMHWSTRIYLAVVDRLRSLIRVHMPSDNDIHPCLVQQSLHVFPHQLCFLPVPAIRAVPRGVEVHNQPRRSTAIHSVSQVPLKPVVLYARVVRARVRVQGDNMYRAGLSSVVCGCGGMRAKMGCRPSDVVVHPVLRAAHLMVASRRQQRNFCENFLHHPSKRIPNRNPAICIAQVAY